MHGSFYGVVCAFGKEKGERYHKMNKVTCTVKMKPGRYTEISVPGGIRTPNLLIRSQKLYPVELQAHFPKSQIPNSKFQTGDSDLWNWDFRSRVADGTRTRNNQNHNLGLYQ